MKQFSQVVRDYWNSQFKLEKEVPTSNDFSVFINPNLEEDSSVMLLELENKVYATISPSVADKLNTRSKEINSLKAFKEAIFIANIQLNGADNIYYFEEKAKANLLNNRTPPNVRQLNSNDSKAFELFQSQISEEDLDGASVELDHWLVFGLFENEKLICVASMYPWHGTKIADLGVLTLSSARGKGYASEVVEAICKHTYLLGYEPQYRCQLDNYASVALAKSCGLSLFGKWDCIAE